MAGLDRGNWGLREGNPEHVCIDFLFLDHRQPSHLCGILSRSSVFLRVTFGASGDCPHSVLFNLIIVRLFPTFSVSVAGDCVRELAFHRTGNHPFSTRLPQSSRSLSASNLA